MRDSGLLGLCNQMIQVDAGPINGQVNVQNGQSAESIMAAATIALSHSSPYGGGFNFSSPIIPTPSPTSASGGSFPLCMG